MVNGVCQSRAGMRQERRANRRCARYQGALNTPQKMTAPRLVTGPGLFVDLQQVFKL
jgi:hypothetical protein